MEKDPYENFSDLIVFIFDYVEGWSVKLGDGRRSLNNGKGRNVDHKQKTWPWEKVAIFP